MKKFENYISETPISESFTNGSYISNREILEIIDTNYEEVSIYETELYDDCIYILLNGNLIYFPSDQGLFNHDKIFNVNDDNFFDRLYDRFKNNKKYLDLDNLNFENITTMALGLIQIRGYGSEIEVTIDIGKKPTKFQLRSLELYIMYYLKETRKIIRITMSRDDSNRINEFKLDKIEDIEEMDIINKIKNFY